MLCEALAFDYRGGERQRLFVLGRQIEAFLRERSLRDLRTLARRFSGSSLAGLHRFARLLTQPGIRLVLFENDAVPLHLFVAYLLEIGAVEASEASPLTRDMDAFLARTRFLAASA